MTASQCKQALQFFSSRDGMSAGVVTVADAATGERLTVTRNRAMEAAAEMIEDLEKRVESLRGVAL